MPKCLLVYFSQGGTTAQVAESIASGLRTAAYQVDSYNLQNEEPPVLSGYDLFGVGLPTYFYRPPFNVTEHVRGLPEMKGLPFFAFVVHGTLPGDAGNQVRSTLTRKGGREVGYFRCFGADYFLGYLREGYLFSPGHPTAEELVQAEAFGWEVTKRAGDLHYTGAQDDPAVGLIYRFERFATNRWLARNLFSRLFLTDTKKCVSCGTCVQDCPTGNIHEDPEGSLVWGRDCLLCLYCEMNCPEGAITSPVSWPLFTPFMKYNVRAASKIPAIDHVRVRHDRGKVERI
jgi:flavodoxin/Pyruvate/2-oxoacid:ferredoxin oxidoreductase delta subunit